MARAPAVACYRAMPDGARYFLIQTLANRTERDRVLRSVRSLAVLEIAGVTVAERAEAIWGLWKIADPRTTDGLIELLETVDDAYVATTAARALIRIGGAKALAAATAFIDRCDDEESAADLQRRR